VKQFQITILENICKLAIFAILINNTTLQEKKSTIINYAEFLMDLILEDLKM
jgi:hypothetical protein